MVLFCVVLCCVVWCCFLFHGAVLHCVACVQQEFHQTNSFLFLLFVVGVLLFEFVLFCFVLCCVMLCCVVLCGVV